MGREARSAAGSNFLFGQQRPADPMDDDGSLYPLIVLRVLPRGVAGALWSPSVRQCQQKGPPLSETGRRAAANEAGRNAYGSRTFKLVAAWFRYTGNAALRA